MEKFSPVSMPSCREAHQLASERLDRRLTLVERTRMRLHLAMCQGCRNFDGQMQLIRRALRQEPPTAELPAASPRVSPRVSPTVAPTEPS